VNIDITVIKDGWHGDTSRMFYVGEPTVQAAPVRDHLRMHVERHPMVQPGVALGDIGAAIQRHAESRLQRGARVLRPRHRQALPRGAADPALRPRGQGLRLQEGMTFTIEPMINAGKRDIRQMNDGWTIVTADHSLSAQWEHTVLVTADGLEVLTVSAGTPHRPPASPKARASRPDGPGRRVP
jgi:methionyl aminopeptidase